MQPLVLLRHRETGALVVSKQMMISSLNSNERRRLAKQSVDWCCPSCGKAADLLSEEQPGEAGTGPEYIDRDTGNCADGTGKTAGWQRSV